MASSSTTKKFEKEIRQWNVQAWFIISASRNKVTLSKGKICVANFIPSANGASVKNQIQN